MSSTEGILAMTGDLVCYVCPARHESLARVAVTGKVPHALPCLDLACAQLAMYRDRNAARTGHVAIEFYSPARAERRRASSEQQEWMEAGGLRVRALDRDGRPLGEAEITRLRALMHRTHLPEAQAVRLLAAASMAVSSGKLPDETANLGGDHA